MDAAWASDEAWALDDASATDAASDGAWDAASTSDEDAASGAAWDAASTSDEDAASGAAWDAASTSDEDAAWAWDADAVGACAHNADGTEVYYGNTVYAKRSRSQQDRYTCRIHRLLQRQVRLLHCLRRDTHRACHIRTKHLHRTTGCNHRDWSWQQRVTRSCQRPLLPQVKQRIIV